MSLHWTKENSPSWDADKQRLFGAAELAATGLDRPAAARGLNYIYNVMPASHPDGAWMTRWLIAQGFTPGPGDLRRRVTLDDRVTTRPPEPV